MTDADPAALPQGSLELLEAPRARQLPSQQASVVEAVALGQGRQGGGPEDRGPPASGALAAGA